MTTGHELCFWLTMAALTSSSVTAVVALIVLVLPWWR
jgi:hypothetical protein